MAIPHLPRHVGLFLTRREQRRAQDTRVVPATRTRLRPAALPAAPCLESQAQRGTSGEARSPEDVLRSSAWPLRAGLRQGGRGSSWGSCSRRLQETNVSRVVRMHVFIFKLPLCSCSQSGNKDFNPLLRCNETVLFLLSLFSVDSGFGCSWQKRDTSLSQELNAVMWRNWCYGESLGEAVTQGKFGVLRTVEYLSLQATKAARGAWWGSEAKQTKTAVTASFTGLFIFNSFDLENANSIL